MRIYCPKCQAGYEVDEALIPEAGRKLRCGNCKEIFYFDRTGMSTSVAAEEAVPQPVSEEVVPEPETNAEEPTAVVGPAAESEAAAETEPEVKISALEAATPEVDMKDIFERLSEQSEHLFQEEQKLPWHKRFLLRLKTMLGLNSKFHLKLVGWVAAVGVLMAMYIYRYEVVRTVPFMNGVYRAVGIRAKIPGEGLEFQNINWNYSDNDGNKVLEVKGFINNPTGRDLEIPVVHVELLDKNTVLLQSINQKPTLESLKADSRVALSIVVKAPSPTAKYVYLTFIDAD